MLTVTAIFHSSSQKNSFIEQGHKSLDSLSNVTIFYFCHHLK